MDARKYDFKVGDWCVDVKTSCIFNEGDEIHVEPKAIELLQLLAKAEGEVVPRETIMDVVWNGRFVTDYALNNVIASLRKYLSSDDKNKYIITRPKRGYQLIASVEFPVLATPSDGMLNKSVQHFSTEYSSKLEASARLNEDENNHRQKTGSNSKLYLILALVCIIIVGIISSVDPIGSSETYKNPIVKRSLAVLPFETQGDASELAYLAVGLSNELIVQFAGSEDLLVMDQRSTKDVVFRSRDAKEVSDLLNVNFVLDGTVYKVMNDTYIDVVLFDELGNERWSSSFVANPESVFTLQDDILQQVHKTMDTESMLMSESNNYYRSTNPQSFENLLKGRALNNQATVEAYKQALSHFQLAIEFDPNYASAYLDLATGFLLLYGANSISLDDANANAKPLIERAKVLAPNNPSTFAVQGMFAMYNSQFNKALDYFLQALKRDPKLYVAHANLAYLYNLQGEHELALEHTLKSLEIHPLAAVPSFQLGNIYFELGKVEKAVQQLQRCIGFVLNYHACHLELAFIQRLIGQSQAAQQTFEDMLSSRPGLADFWVVLNQGFHAWWQNDLALASSYYDQLYQEHQTNFSFLPSYTWLKWQMGSHQAFMQELHALENSSSDKPSTYLFDSLALLAYADGNCESMFEYYRRSEDISPSVPFQASALMEGYSDDLNKAACYHQQQQDQLAQPLLEGVENTILSLDVMGQSAPGIVLIRAKLDVLQGRQIDHASLKARLEKQQYPHVWMLTEDWLFQ